MEDTLLVPVIAAFVSAAILLIIRGIAMRILHRLAARTETALDEIVLHSLKWPSVYWCLAIGVYIGAEVSEIPEKYVFYITKAIYILLVISVTIAASNLTGRLFRLYVGKLSLPIPTTGLAYGLVKGFIYIIGLLIALSLVGVSIAPLLTALGVGGLAVALALKDTLENLFAGIYIMMEKTVRVGDFIRLETGQEGYVQDITWRTTRVRMLPNNVVIVPNSKLAQSVVVNYFLPEKRMSLLIPVGVSYSADPEKVERLLVEEAKNAVNQVPGLLGDPEPFVRFIPGFGESSLDFTLICQITEFTEQYTVQHELRKRIFSRFQAEGIEIPFPHRTVYLKAEKETEGDK